MGKAFDFLQATNDVLTERGATLSLEGRTTTTPEDRAERGLAVQREIVGADAVDHMYAAASNDELHLQRLLSANCFGDHYTRGGVELQTRELWSWGTRTGAGPARHRRRVAGRTGSVT